MLTQTTFNVENNWININTDNKDELRRQSVEYGLDEDIIDYSLDTNERARLDYDRESKLFMLIYNVPNRDMIDNHYETTPMSFILKEDKLITITNNKNYYLYEKMREDLEKEPNQTVFEFLFSSLFMITDQFFPYVEEMNSDRVNVSNRLKEKTTKQNLLSLSDLETGIVFYISASKQNVVLLEQIRTHTVYKRLTDDEKEKLDDVLVEAKQVMEMTQISSQILQQLSGTYNNVLNNNLNETMRILTVLSVLLTIPTIITGFFGMNMPLPLENNTFGWMITVAMSIGLWFLLSFILRRFMR
ncbi:magnesium transporter CorA family protein [Vagococcus vulneris]|uniref:Magnesium transporter CorA n=1 Tax=Vagococcus vulneris TaxID=1977869 RepID=A0A429ZZY2_9ENTE|nr:magnesium transporter CorA family protein [Vagococcus vulneris]RST99610.1 magnesium transporter CorA [Vagococcus vulneris]